MPDESRLHHPAPILLEIGGCPESLDCSRWPLQKSVGGSVVELHSRCQAFLSSSNGDTDREAEAASKTWDGKGEVEPGRGSTLWFDAEAAARGSCDARQ